MCSARGFEARKNAFFWAKSRFYVPQNDLHLLCGACVKTLRPHFLIRHVAPKHRRGRHSQLFADKHSHINGIENFWNQAKRHMCRFNSVPQQHFYWLLKECEWRFNGGNHKTLMGQLKRWYKQAQK